MRRVDKDRIRSLRGDDTQEDIARRTGLSLSTVRAIERGRIQSPNTLTLRALAEALGVSIDEITTRDDDEAAGVPA
jgi:transcriptional regulator with XRE-family HTH domain